MSQSLSLQNFQQILNLIENFQKRENHLLNLTKFFDLLKLSKENLNDIIEILIRFQTLFNSTLKDFRFIRYWKNNQIYLKLISKSDNILKSSLITTIIELTHEHTQLLNDIIYYFEHVKIGKGFDIRGNNSELTHKVSKLKKEHPYFFEIKGNGFLYPTKLASQLGNMIGVYKRGNRKIKNIEIDEYKIKVV